MDQLYTNQLDVEEFFLSTPPSAKTSMIPSKIHNGSLQGPLSCTCQTKCITNIDVVVNVIIRAPLSIKNGTQVSNSWLMWYDVIDIVDVHLGLYFLSTRTHEPLFCTFGYVSGSISYYFELGIEKEWAKKESL